MPRRYFPPLARPVRALAACAVALAAAATAPAQTPTNFYWNAPGGGAGAWNTLATNPNWSSTPGGPTDYAWTNSGFEVANFGGTGGAVALDAGGITAYGINFTAGGYTLGGGPLTLAGAGGVIDTGAFNATIGSAIGGTVGLTKNGTGTLTLGGTNTYTGVTTVSAGVLAITTGGALGGTADGTVVSAGAALHVSGTVSVAEPLTLNGDGISGAGALRNTANNNTWSGAVTLGSAARINSDAGTLTVSTGGINGAGAGQDLTVGGAGNTTISGTIGSTVGAIAKDGTGTLALSGTGNAYTGVTTITAGVVAVSVAGGLGATSSGTVVTGTGAALNVSGSGVNIGAEPLTLNGPGVSNAGALRKTGTGTTTVGGPITVGSNTRINADAGTLSISGAVNVGANTLTVGGAGATTISGQITLSTAGTFIHDSASTVTISSSANGGASGTFLGSIQVTNGGVLSFPSQTTLGTTNAAGTILLDNGTLLNTATGNAGTYVTTNRNIVLGPGGGTLRWDDTTLTATTGPDLIIVQNTAPGTTIQGTQGGALNKAGGGIIAIAQPATYDGPTNVLAGALRVRTFNNVFPTGTALSVSGGATFDLNGVNQQVASLTGAGDVNLSGGTFVVGNSTSTTFTGRFTEAVYAGNGSIGGKVTKVGTGTLTVGSNNFYSGATTISAGVLSVSNLTDGGVSGFTVTTTQGSTSATVSSAAGLAVGMTIVNRNLTSGSTIANISGTTITLSAAATQTVSGSAAAAGLPGGIGIAPGAAGNLVLNGGTLQYTGPGAGTDRLFTVTSAGGTLDSSGTGPVAFTNTGADPATDKAVTNFTLTGGSTFVALSSTGTPADLTGIAVGMPVSGTGIPAGATVASVGGTLNGFTLSAAATTSAANTPLTFTSLNRTLTLTGSNTGANTIAGALADSPTTTLALAKSGAGLWVLSGANTYTGGTTVSAGTLQLGAGGTTGSIAGNVTDNAALRFNRSDTYTFAGVISGSGAVTQAGTGTTVLTGANTYTGPTAVNAGTLRVNGDQTAATGAVTVAAIGTLAGAGTVGGTVSVGGTVAPGGATSPGTLTSVGGVGLAANANLSVRIGANGSNPGVTPGTSDLLAVTGSTAKLDFATGSVLKLSPDTSSTFDRTQPAVYTVGTVATAGNITLDGAAAPATLGSLVFSGATPTATGTGPVKIDVTAFTGLQDGDTFSLTQNGTAASLGFTPAPVPEPASAGLLAAAALGLGAAARRRRGV